jgi:hypothetical protein
MILPFRNFERSEPSKPRASKRPVIRPTPPKKAAPPAGPVPLSDRMTLADVLKRVGKDATVHLYHHLGLAGTKKTSERRIEIIAVLRDPDVLAKIVKSLPGETRNLLRTVVRAGGFVPASVLFQNTGPDSPPPDYVQPLLINGLLFFGTDASAAKKDGRLIAVVPVDLVNDLARAMRIKLGG